MPQGDGAAATGVPPRDRARRRRPPDGGRGAPRSEAGSDYCSVLEELELNSLEHSRCLQKINALTWV